MITERPKIILLDMIETLLNIDEAKKAVENLLGGNKNLSDLWFSNMLLYSLVDTLTDEYHDFGKIAYASFEMTAEAHGISFNSQDVIAAIRKINESSVYPDVVRSLVSLKNADYKLVTFTNSSNAAIQNQIKSNNIEHLIDKSISTEDIGYFKPHRHTYFYTARYLNVKPEECLLVASHGWDISGAISAGMKTAFISHNRYKLYPLSQKPDIEVVEAAELAEILCNIR